MDDELKQKAALYLKQISDASKSATKTAFLSFAALAIIWVTQIRPQYDRLLNYVYPALPKLNQELKKEKKLRQEVRDEVKSTAAKTLVPQSSSPDAVGQDLMTQTQEQPDRQKTQTQERLDRQRQQVKIKRSELEKGVTNVAFDIFGLKIPVAPLFAAVVWNLALLAVLLYLARARSSIWGLCANALYALKRSGRNAQAFDDIAGNGPLWLAPVPSRPGREDVVTSNDLRLAFGWHRLDTLPSIAATIGILLLCLLQLAVTLQGYQVIKSARAFTLSLTAGVDRDNNTPVEHPEELDSRVASIAVSLAQPNQPNTDDQDAATTFDLQRQVMSLTLGKFLGSVISWFLLLIMLATFVIVIWWFRPARVPGHLAGYDAPPQHRAKVILGVAGVIGSCLIVSFFKPDWGLRFGEALSSRLELVTIFLAGAMITFCLIELASLAVFRPVESKKS